MAANVVGQQQRRLGPLPPPLPPPPPWSAAAGRTGRRAPPPLAPLPLPLPPALAFPPSLHPVAVSAPRATARAASAAAARSRADHTALSMAPLPPLPPPPPAATKATPVAATSILPMLGVGGRRRRWRRCGSALLFIAVGALLAIGGARLLGAGWGAASVSASLDTSASLPSPSSLPTEAVPRTPAPPLAPFLFADRVHFASLRDVDQAASSSSSSSSSLPLSAQTRAGAGPCARGLVFVLCDGPGFGRCYRDYVHAALFAAATNRSLTVVDRYWNYRCDARRGLDCYFRPPPNPLYALQTARAVQAVERAAWKRKAVADADALTAAPITFCSPAELADHLATAAAVAAPATPSAPAPSPPAATAEVDDTTEWTLDTLPDDTDAMAVARNKAVAQARRAGKRPLAPPLPAPADPVKEDGHADGAEMEEGAPAMDLEQVRVAEALWPDAGDRAGGRRGRARAPLPYLTDVNAFDPTVPWVLCNRDHMGALDRWVTRQPTMGFLLATRRVVAQLWQLRPEVEAFLAERRAAAMLASLQTAPVYVGVHIRSGDKARQTAILPTDLYLRRAVALLEGWATTSAAAAGSQHGTEHEQEQGEHGDHRGGRGVAGRLQGGPRAGGAIFLASDNVSAIAEARRAWPAYTLASIYGAEGEAAAVAHQGTHELAGAAAGHDQSTFNRLPHAVRGKRTLHLLLELQLLAEATWFVGTFSSNLGRLVQMLRWAHAPQTAYSLDVPWTAA